MSKNAFVAIYVVLLIAAVVSVDVLFFRDRFRERLLANIGIVIVFVAVYFLAIRNR
ncbi:MAG: hypothetical protein JOZ75_13875 [Candidatus Dormibacteraeota bacterium]|nr:hypothetical protein [Candidatus Dormibacteraeota bacterium]